MRVKRGKCMRERAMMMSVQVGCRMIRWCHYIPPCHENMLNLRKKEWVSWRGVSPAFHSGFAWSVDHYEQRWHSRQWSPWRDLPVFLQLCGEGSCGSPVESALASAFHVFLSRTYTTHMSDFAGLVASKKDSWCQELWNFGTSKSRRSSNIFARRTDDFCRGKSPHQALKYTFRHSIRRLFSKARLRQINPPVEVPTILKKVEDEKEN